MNIIITGAGKGIGFETVKAFSKDPDNNIIAILLFLSSCLLYMLLGAAYNAPLFGWWAGV